MKHRSNYIRDEYQSVRAFEGEGEQEEGLTVSHRLQIFIRRNLSFGTDIQDL
jgi:hypothetical protein